MKLHTEVSGKSQRMERCVGLALFFLLLFVLALLQGFNLKRTHDAMRKSTSLSSNTPQYLSNSRLTTSSGMLMEASESRPVLPSTEEARTTEGKLLIGETNVVMNAEPQLDSSAQEWKASRQWTQQVEEASARRTAELINFEKEKGEILERVAAERAAAEKERQEVLATIQKEVEEKTQKAQEAVALGKQVEKLEKKLQIWEKVRDQWFENVAALMSELVVELPFTTFITTAPRGPAEMYLRSTLNSLWASGLKEVTIAYGRPEDEEMAYVTRLVAEFDGRLAIRCSPMPRDLWNAVETLGRPEHETKRAKINANAYRMYRELQHEGKHVLHLQDDIIVSSYFALRVTQLLTRLRVAVGESAAYVVHLFVPYRMDRQPDIVPGLAKYSRPDGFWGSQALTYSPEVIRSGHLAQWYWDVGVLPKPEGQALDGHDITLREYLKKFDNVTLYGVKDSLVQHMGKDSSIREGQFHEFKQVGKGKIHGYYVDDRRSEMD